MLEDMQYSDKQDSVLSVLRNFSHDADCPHTAANKGCASPAAVGDAHPEVPQNGIPPGGVETDGTEFLFSAVDAVDGQRAIGLISASDQRIDRRVSRETQRQDCRQNSSPSGADW